MFYSHTLSTVWTAAILQRKLKKSDCTSTDIPSTVQHIMDQSVLTEVSIALITIRSGFLLLGVVRIYSKKVDYLLHDSNVVLAKLTKPFASIELTLPEEERQAPFNSITLPETLDLDALNMDDELDDRIPIVMDHYIVISFDEVKPYSLHVTYSSHTEVLRDSGSKPMEEDLPQATQAHTIEILRDHNNGHNIEISQVFTSLGDDDAEPNRDHDKNMNEKDHVLEMINEMDPEGMFAPSRPHSGPPTPDNSQVGTSDAQVHGENNSPNSVLCPPIQQPQRRERKRKQFFDNRVVLSNKLIDKTLNDTSRILRKRRKVSSFNFVTWKLNNSRKKEHIFYQPLLTGFCNDLLDMSKSEYVRSKSHLVISEEDHADARDATTLSPTNQIPEEPIADTHTVTASDMDIEHPRNVAFTPPPNVPAHDVVEGDYKSPDRRDDMTTASPQISVVTETMRAPDLAASPGGHGLETMQTPDSDTRHLINSAEADELGFLEIDSNTPASSQGTSGSITLSERTRCVAQHLKGWLSPITPNLEEPAGVLSLDKVLEGKKRKFAARMFSKVLVLTHRGLIGVQQEVSYGDISLTLSPTLLINAQI